MEVHGVHRGAILGQGLAIPISCLWMRLSRGLKGERKQSCDDQMVATVLYILGDICLLLTWTLLES